MKKNDRNTLILWHNTIYDHKMSKNKTTEQGDFKESLDVKATMLNKGNLLIKLKNYGEALECFNKVIRLDPENSEAWNNKGKILETLGKSGEAIVCYDEAMSCRVDPTEEEEWVGLTSRGYEIDPENIITLSDEDTNRIKEFIPKRFGTIQEFVTRAINVNAAWEEDPLTAAKVFGQKVPTMKQYHFLFKS